MRIRRQIGKATLGVLLVLITGIVGCEGSGQDKDNDPGEPKTIMGDSVLEVTAKDDITNVYFDGDYIGTMAPDETRDFNVPAGVHAVRFTNAEHDNQKPDSLTIDFKKGFVHPVTITWKKDNSLF